jgi:protease-4
MNEDIETKILKSQLGEHYNILRQVKQYEKLNGVQARMPYDLIFR